jgi:hypothetical protein
MRCQVALLLLAISGLAGCSFIPWYSYTNKESDSTTAPAPRPVENFYRAVSLRPILPTDVPSGTSKASITNVPWQISAACRTVAAPPPGEPIPEHCRDDRFVSLAISGGGSRASIFGAEL